MNAPSITSAFCLALNFFDGAAVTHKNLNDVTENVEKISNTIHDVEPTGNVQLLDLLD